MKAAQGAVTYTWTGAASTTFASSANWSSTTGLYPGNATSDVALFNIAPTGNEPNLVTGDIISALVFSSSTATGYTLSESSGSLSLNSIGTTNSGASASAVSIAASNTTETISAPVNFNAAGVLQAVTGVSGTDIVTFSGGISGSAGTLQFASDTVALPASSSFSGAIAQRSGSTLLLGNSNALGSGTIYSNTGGIGTLSASTALTGASAVANPIVWVGSSTTLDLAGSNALELSGAQDLASAARTFNVTNTAGAIISGVISDDGGNGLSITSSGGGILTLSETNTYTGATTISGSGEVLVPTIGNSSGSTPSPLGESTTINLSGSTSLTGGLYYTGTGETTNKVINLSATSGSPNISVIDSGSNTTSASPLNFSANLTTAGVSMARNLTLQGAGYGVFSGNIGNGTGSVSLTKGGSGTWTLSGTNSYTGGTSITGGVLNMTGSPSASSAVSVSTTGTLAGSGSMGAITVNVGTVNPSGAGGLATIGTITAPSYTMTGGGTLTINLDPTSTSASEVIVSATPSFTGGSTLYLNLINAGNPIGKTYVIVENTTSTAATAVANDFTHLLGGGGYPYTINYSYNADAGSVANDVAVTFTPEPSALGVLAIGSVSLLRRRRRLSVRPLALRHS